MNDAAADPAYVLAQYEALRQEATTTTPGGPRGHGLTVFLTRGMSGWLAVLTALAPWRPSTPLRSPAPCEEGPRLLPAARAELATVLAGMVLACTQQPEGR